VKWVISSELNTNSLDTLQTFGGIYLIRVSTLVSLKSYTAIIQSLCIVRINLVHFYPGNPNSLLSEKF